MKGAIFDLDGVLVDTAAIHYRAWRELAQSFGFDLTPELNEQLKGVNRERCLEIILTAAGLDLPPEERQRLTDRKNARFIELVSGLGPEDLLPGARRVLETLRARGVRLAIGSGSRNAPMVIDRLGIRNLLDVVVDGAAASKPKPDPEVFLVAAALLGVEPEECVVFEDAESGVQAARAGGMAVVGIGDDAILQTADFVVASLADLDVDSLFPVVAA